MEYELNLPYYIYSVQETAAKLGVEINLGLCDDEVSQRLKVFGLNELKKNFSSWWKILLSQFLNVMTIILAIATAASFASKDWVEAGVILFVLITNSVVGFIQEYSAEKTMETLKSLSSPTATVVRNIDQIETIPAKFLVPGDIIVLQEGDVVPADCRIVTCFHLSLDEALLTGETRHVQKTSEALENENIPIGDRLNMVYASTTVSSGRGNAIVIKTGMKTEVGKIASELSSSSDSSLSSKTPAQKSLMQLAYFLFLVVILLSLIVFAVNRFELTREVITYAIAVSIAVIPEGLVAIITITMALGVRKMAKEKAIIRKLVALESLGSITNICSDKTGTLTQGKMVARKIFVPHEGFYHVSGDGYRPVGEFYYCENLNEKQIEGKKEDSELSASALKIVLCSSLCNLSIVKLVGLSEDEQEQTIRRQLRETGHLDFNSKGTSIDDWQAFGDPTESALNVLALKANISKNSLTKSADAKFKLVQEFPFDSNLKRMTTIYLENDTKKYLAFCKGGVEVLLERSKSLLDSNPVNFNNSKAEIIKTAEEMAVVGLRVLSFCMRELKETNIEKIMNLSRDELEKDLEFLGLVGIYDPPRPETSGAIQRCKAAGITIHMLTGDHIKTAESISKEIGIIENGQGIALTAEQFDNMTEEQVDEMPTLPLVIARCSPATKVKMVQAIRRRNMHVAMTGDGTNDAPSLKMADVGIAMGLGGSDVAKAASSIVLTDDNFATIVYAVFEGRRIFSNIQKFVLHLMSTNVAQVIVMIIGLSFTDTNGKSVFPMCAVQILFQNMVTSTPPAISLGLEKGYSDLMKQPPRKADIFGRGIFSLELILDIFAYGIMMGGISLVSFIISLCGQGSWPNIQAGCDSSQEGIQPGCVNLYRARGTTFIVFTLLILVHAYNCRHPRKSIIVGQDYGGFVNITSNLPLFLSCCLGSILSVLTVYVPGINDVVFKQTSISWEWGPIVGMILLFISASELYKLSKRSFLSDHKDEGIDMIALTSA